MWPISQNIHKVLSTETLEKDKHTRMLLQTPISIKKKVIFDNLLQISLPVASILVQRQLLQRAG